MAYRYLSNRLATTIKFQFNPSTTVKSPLATANRYSTMSSEDYATVSYVTTPDENVARQLARGLVEKRLAACVNIVKKIESIYEWKGKIEQDDEALMIIKSKSRKSQDIAEFLKENHPYDCPEFISLKVDSGSEPYLNWIQETINRDPTSSKE